MLLDQYPKINTDLVKEIPWEGDELYYDQQLYNLGERDTEFLVINPYIRHPSILNFVNYVPKTRKCIVWTYKGEWTAKLFKNGWHPYHGYETYEIEVLNNYVWKRNPAISHSITFDINPIENHTHEWSDLEYKLVWYIDPRVNPLEDKVWAFSCEATNVKTKGEKDMGYVMPDLTVTWNPDIPKMQVNIDECYPAFWSLDNVSVIELDPNYSPAPATWMIKFEPKHKKSSKWEWMGTVSPEFKIEQNPSLPEMRFDLDYDIPWHDLAYEHIWYLDKEINGEKVWALKITPSAEIVGVKEMGTVTPLIAATMDVIFISYNEPNAEENWARVLEKAPHAKRVNGVEGIFEAHKAAAKLAITDMFFVVDGDAYLVDDWQFNFQPGIFDRDCTYVWHSKNPLNDLTYGYGGVKLFPRKSLTRARKWNTLDLSTTITSKLKVIETVSNITAFNTDEYSTWRSAFREVVKLCETIKRDTNDTDAIHRLDTWKTVGLDKPFGNYAIAGANAAVAFFDRNYDTPQLRQINNGEWLYTMFKNEKPSVFNYKPIKIVKQEEIVVDPTVYTRLEHSNPDHADWFVVNWCLGNTCNFSCSYCPIDLHDASIPWPDLDVIKNFIMKIKQAHPSKKIYFEFTGGEVTLYKHFVELCQFCTEHGVKVGLISNGSRTLRYWEENKQYFDHVCLSFHPEEADEKHFIEVVKILNNDVRTHVNIMMSPEKFDFCYAVANKVKNLGNISMALQPLIHDFGDTLYDYNEFQKKIFDKQHELIVKHIKYTKTFDYYRGAMVKLFPDGNKQVSSAQRFVSDKTNDWSGWKCYAGVEQLIVDKDGSVHRGWCKEGGMIGRITDPELNLSIGPVVCGSTMCHCNFDIMCTKEK
jgi:MoaA/NifB/PqqE/SkfB family radical SAM enzyme